MKLIPAFLLIALSGPAMGQLLDLEMECPIIYPPAYIVQNNIHSISFTESGDNIKKVTKKHSNAVLTYYFDSTGTAYMKVLNDAGDYTDTFMMNAMRCAYKGDPESRYYEENLFCNERWMILANQTEKSSFFYHYDKADRLREWIQIDREEDQEANVLLTRYSYDSIGHMDSIIEKEGALRYNLGIRQMDTIYRSTVIRSVKYDGDRMSTVITYTNNNREQTIAASVYKYKYKGDRLESIDLYIGEEKKPIYSLKVIKMTIAEKDE